MKPGSHVYLPSRDELARLGCLRGNRAFVVQYRDGKVIDYFAVPRDDALPTHPSWWRRYDTIEYGAVK